MSTAQLNKEAEELLAADPENDRLEDGLATDAVKVPAGMGLPVSLPEVGPSKKKSGKSKVDSSTGKTDKVAEVDDEEEEEEETYTSSAWCQKKVDTVRKDIATLMNQHDSAPLTHRPPSGARARCLLVLLSAFMRRVRFTHAHCTKQPRKPSIFRLLRAGRWSTKGPTKVDRNQILL